MRRACPACSRPATCAGGQSSGSDPRSARARSPFRRCMPASKLGQTLRLPASDDGMSHDTATRSVKPAAVKPLLPGMRRLLYVAAVLVLLAGFQLFVFTDRTASYFAWTIRNPLAAAFLGAGYWASVSFEALAARQRIWANARIAVPTVLTFTVLTLVATLAHLDLFHLGSQFATGTRTVTWAWIAIYVLVPLLMLIILVVQLRTPGGDPPRSAPMPSWVYALLAVQAVVLLSEQGRQFPGRPVVALETDAPARS